MKKIIYLLSFSFLLLFVVLVVPSSATETPNYDPNYNNNSGAFYAKGTPITISQNPQSEEGAVITWNNENVTVPKTVTIFGGGSKGESYDSSNITMEGGEIFSVVGGGISTEQGSTSTVQNASITINGGTVSANVVGGGYLYATVENSSITVNNGIVEGIVGGGFASIMIDSRIHTVGTPEQAKQSPNRVNKVDIVINNVTMPPSTLPGGFIYGGGQSNSYVGESNLTIHGGDFTKAYITAGGADGYTETSNVKISGGTINTFQTVNKGTVNSATVYMTSGTITDFFVGGKTGDLSVTGAINKAQINILSGTIEDLQPGISNSSTLDIDKQNYKVVKTQNFTVKDNHLKPGSIIDVVYNIEISPKELFLKPEESKQLKSVITIEPSEYAYLFQDYLLWKSENPNIASVTKIGTVNAVNLGKTKITAQLLDESGTVIVTVKNSDDPSTDVNILAVIIILSLIALLVILLSILI